MWYRLFFWFGLFTVTAFYVDLLMQTFHDIFAFMLLYVLIVSAFANVLFILNEKKRQEDGESLYEDKMGNQIADSFIGQYLLGLGEFEYGAFSGSD